MKTFILTVLLSMAAIALAACGQNATNSNSAMNHGGMNHNTMMNSNSMNMNGMNHNSMPMNAANHDMSGMHHSQMMGSDPNAPNAPYDLQFLDTMSAHHQGAVEMSEMVLKKSQNAELKTFAQKIIDDQKKEIAQMKEWREKWYAGKPRAMNMEMPGMSDSMKMMTGDDMKKMEAAMNKDFDLHFLDMMTPHHQGAVVMAREALQKAERPEIKTLAQDIIREQEKEIKQMTDWKAQWSK